MSTGNLEARLSALEQIIIIIIIGGGGIVHPPKGDSFSTDLVRLDALSRLTGFRPPFGPGTDPPVTDTNRLEALYRILGHQPVGDRFSPDITRLSAIDLESEAHKVNAELVRLKALEGQIQQRLKELKTPPQS
jgi:hypothetical protein